MLVVGIGNSGSDIALDLAGGGVREVWLSARSAPGVVRRQALGLPAQVAAVPLSRAPRPLAAAIAGLERRLFIGDLSALQGGRRLRPDAVVAATGYRPALVPLVGHLGVLGTDGLPLHHGGAAHPAVPGLHFTGFRNPITGALRELRVEAGAIARARSAVV